MYRMHAIEVKAGVVAGAEMAVQERPQCQQADHQQGQPASQQGGGECVHRFIIEIARVSAVTPTTQTLLLQAATAQAKGGSGATPSAAAGSGQ